MTKQEFINNWIEKLEVFGFHGLSITFEMGVHIKWESVDRQNESMQVILTNIDKFVKGVRNKIYNAYLIQFPNQSLNMGNANGVFFAQNFDGQTMEVSTRSGEELVNIIRSYLVDEDMNDESDVAIVYNTDTNLEEKEIIVPSEEFKFLLEEGEVTFIDYNDDDEDKTLRVDLDEIATVKQLGKITDGFDKLNAIEDSNIFEYDNGNEVTLNLSNLIMTFSMFEGIEKCSYDEDSNELTIKPTGINSDSTEVLRTLNQLQISFPLYIADNTYTDENGVVINLNNFQYTYDINDTDLPVNEKLTRTQVTKDLLEDDTYCILREPTNDPENLSLHQFCVDNNIFMIKNLGEDEDGFATYIYLGFKADLKRLLINFWGYVETDYTEDFMEPYDRWAIENVEMDTNDPDQEDLLYFVKDNKIKMEFVEEGPMGPIYKYTGTVISLLQMLDEFWGNEPELLANVFFDKVEDEIVVEEDVDADSQPDYQFKNDQPLKYPAQKEAEAEKYWKNEANRVVPGVIDLKFDYTDNWGRNVYVGSEGEKFVDVDGVLHEMTDTGEPLIPRFDLQIPTDDEVIIDTEKMKLQSDFNKMKNSLLESLSNKTNYKSWSEKKEITKEFLKSKEVKEFLNLLTQIPIGTKISQKHWANYFVKNEDGSFRDNFARKNLSPKAFVLDRISNNSTTHTDMEFEYPTD